MSAAAYSNQQLLQHRVSALPARTDKRILTHGRMANRFFRYHRHSEEEIQLTPVSLNDPERGDIRT